MDFGGDTFGGTAVATSNGDWHGLYVFFDNPELAQAMARKNRMTVRGMNIEDTTVDLAGTAVSFRSIRACQDDQAE